MSDETTLLFCPFCKSEAVLDKVDEGADYRPWFWYTVHCSNRDCVCADLCHEYETEAEAITAWNTRTDYHGYEQAAIEAWESIKAWNTRAELGSGTCELREASWDDGTCTWGVICSACGEKHEHTHGYGWNFAPCCGRRVKR